MGYGGILTRFVNWGSVMSPMISSRNLEKLRQGSENRIVTSLGRAALGLAVVWISLGEAKLDLTGQIRSFAVE